jgi:DNA-directed RNA polymerase subunit M/transcription elongation factor TFIIS
MMTPETKQLKRVCKCENCGNEAEMLITCTLETSHDHETDAAVPGTEAAEKPIKGTGTCTACGSEADMWIDL